jgi:hypothetical protein
MAFRYRSWLRTVASWVVVCAGLVSCGAGPASPPDCAPSLGEVCPVLAPPAEVGFVEIEPAEYWLGEVRLVSSRAQLFYAYLPAQESNTRTPTFVLTGGGPAGSTMFLLASHAQTALVGDELQPIAGGANPWALTGLGHVLYIDARNAGYSYAQLDDPSDANARGAEFGAHNYNVYRDAADVWRALFGFWRQHPELDEQPIYLMAESYGGMRVTAMLDMLVHAEAGDAESQWYRDSGLRAEFASRARDGLRVAGQIVLQAIIAGRRQLDAAGELYERSGSIVDLLASRAGARYVRCAERGDGCDRYLNAIDFLHSIDRSPYDYDAPSSWLDEHIQRLSFVATRRQTVASLLGLEIASLDGVLGTARPGAYRFADATNAQRTMRGDLDQSYGPVEPWDAYFVALNREATDVFNRVEAESLLADARQAGFGDLFLANLRQVPTMATRADRDLVVYGESLVPALASYPGVRTVALAGEEIHVDWLDGASRAIFSPSYASSHSVSRELPDKLFSDLARFVEWSN